MTSDNNPFGGFHIPSAGSPPQNTPPQPATSENAAPPGGQHIPAAPQNGQPPPPSPAGGIQFGRPPQSAPPTPQPAATPTPVARPAPEPMPARPGQTLNDLEQLVSNDRQPASAPTPSGGLHISSQKPAAEDISGQQTEAHADSEEVTPELDTLPDIPSFSEGDIDDLKNGASEAADAAIVLIFDYIRENFGSDLHIGSESVPRMRLFGEIEPIPHSRAFTEMEVYGLIRATMNEETWEQFLETSDVDYSFIDNKGRRYRCNAMQTLGGPAAVFRIISDKILSFHELRLPRSVENIAECKKGLILVTGATGCGKSTTLATLVDMLNQKDQGHILTVEDPVEILHHSKKSLVNHREVKTHTKSFARALKSALREDPDSIMIGEMRDLETISLALTAAETGHLVFGTLHTSSAPKTITRIIDVFPSGEQPQIRAMLAESVQCVISQVLCKRRDGNGRVAAFEVMFGTPGIRNLIRMDKVYQIPSAISTGMHDGMQTLDQALEKLVKDGVISLDEAKLHARHPEELKV